MNPESDVVNKVLNHYKKLSTVFGLEMKPDEQFVNGLGYQFLQMGQFEVSEQFFKLNVTNFPESFNVYDSIGDYYVAKGDKDNAIESFKKALALNKNATFSKDKLEALLGD
jgi:tetratricopeptide (TPR) repeat protein